THSDADRTLDFRALDFQITQLTKKVTVLQEQNELFRAENEKVKQHYKKLYDFIKIVRAKHIKQINALLTKNENLKAQLHENMKCVIMDSIIPRVLSPGRYAIDVKPIPPCNRNNREVRLDYLKHLKESVETLREIVEEAKQTENVNTSKTVITEKLSNTSQKPLTSYQPRNKQYKAIPTSIPTPTVNQAIDTSMQTDVGRTDRPLLDSGMTTLVLSWVMEIKKHSCYVQDTDGVELIKGSRGSSLYTILIEDMMKSSPICLLSKASKNKSWLWHRCLNHLNFGTINDLARKDLVRGLHRLKFEKDYLCSAFRRTPQQNGVVKRRNRTLVEAARTMLIFSKALMFLWAEATATTFPVLLNSASIPSSTTIDQDAPSLSHSLSSSALQYLSLHQGIATGSTINQDNPFAPVDNNPFVNLFAPEPSSKASSSGDVSSAESTHITQPHHYFRK
ncbi:integrase, catalytic region, zinc finger, CCHC-type containing protein, partial [Tanacetum coccineum]